MFIRYLVILFLLMSASTAFAEEKDVTKFEEIVVTATRTEKEVETAPGIVNVVTKKEMETRNVKTVDEALDTLPGVFNRRQSLTDTQSSILLHGIPDQKRTLILKDGVTLNNGYDGSVSFTGLSTENIEKIEVVFSGVEIEAIFASAKNETPIRKHLFKARRKYSLFERMFDLRLEF